MMLVALLLPLKQSFAEQEPVSDIRIIIDVSGSMKKNDPNNLRAPALRMLVGLLPDKASSGVWTFAKYVNMLVPHREVNDAWRLEAEKQSKKIHSLGLFTDIEQALNKATANQKNDDAKVRRSVILLSDGLVDISKNDDVSKKSRQRILDIVIPRLKDANIAVHTIALSDSSDHALLRSISLATDGWYEQVDNADQLQRVFLHMFEKAAQRDTVPLKDNNFKIDDSVSEMTLLVFRMSDTKPTELVAPDHSRISNQNLPANVRWHHEDSYDLITISDPQSGAWIIDADLDPDNRVMVITDLKLKTTNLPNNILIGETFDFEASLTEQGETITRIGFLNLVDARLKEESETAYSVKQDLNTMLQDGIYRTHVGKTFQPGRNDIVITMISKTFERQRRQSINVVETPLEITVEQLIDASTRTHRLTLKPDVSLIKTENLTIAALLTAEDGSEWSYDVIKGSNDQWQLTLAELTPFEEYSVALQIKGETQKGRALFLQPESILLIDETQQQEAEPEIAPPIIEEEIIMEEIVDDEMADLGDDLLEDIDEEVTELLDEDSVNNEGVMSASSKLVIGNVIILLFVAIAFFMWRRNAASRKNPGDQL